MLFISVTNSVKMACVHPAMLQFLQNLAESMSGFGSVGGVRGEEGSVGGGVWGEDRAGGGEWDGEECKGTHFGLCGVVLELVNAGGLLGFERPGERSGAGELCCGIEGLSACSSCCSKPHSSISLFIVCTSFSTNSTHSSATV